MSSPMLIWNKVTMVLLQLDSSRRKTRIVANGLRRLLTPACFHLELLLARSSTKAGYTTLPSLVPPIPNAGLFLTPLWSR